jgi:hypothetical protein
MMIENEAAIKVAEILEGASWLNVSLVAYGGACVIAILFCNLFRTEEKLSFKTKAIAYAGVVLCVCLVTHFTALPYIRSAQLEEANLVIELAKSKRLTAETTKNIAGETISGRVKLVEYKTEKLFNKELELSAGWSRSVSLETARELSEYLAKNNEGSIAWRGQR